MLCGVVYILNPLERTASTGYIVSLRSAYPKELIKIDIYIDILIIFYHTNF